MDLTMNSKQFLESTTSGSVATVATPVGKTQTRGKGIYPNEKGGNLLTGKKTNEKFANSKSVKESQEPGVSEARVKQLPPGAADYSDYSVDELKTLLRPGIMHRDEAKFKVLIRRELKKREQQSQQGVAEASFTAAASMHAATRKQSGGKTAQPTHGIKVGDTVTTSDGKQGSVTFVHGDDIQVTGTNFYYPDSVTKHSAKDLKKGVAEGPLNEATRFTSWYDWRDQAKSSGYTITRKDDKIVALNKQGQVVGHWSDVGKFLSGKAPRPNFKRPADQGVAEGFPHDVDHMPGKTVRHQDTNCTTCHGRKSMYKLGSKLFADNKQGAEKVKCPTCKGTGDKQGVAEGSDNNTAIIYDNGYVKIDGNMYKAKRMNHESGMGIAIQTPSKMYFSPIANEYEMPSVTIHRALKLGGLNPIFNEGVTEGRLMNPSDDKKQISKYEKLALAANRAGDDEKCKLYQKKIQALKQKMSQSVAEGSDELKVGIEAYGVRGANSNKWKKTFKSQEAFEKWLDQNEGDVEVSGTREVNLNDMFKESMKEAKLDEEDIIIVPGQGKKYKQGFIPKAKDRTDHEVEMALSDLFQSAKNAKQVYELIKDIPESVGIEGWVQEKIIKANDYLNTIREYLEHKQMGQGMAEGEETKLADLSKISSDKLYKFIYVHKNAGNIAAAERGRKELERRGIKTKDISFKSKLAEDSDELYQRAIRKYTQRIASNYLGGGNEHSYGGNTFPADLFEVDPEQVRQDFKMLFPQYLKKLQGITEGSDRRSFLEKVDDFLVDYAVTQIKNGFQWNNGYNVIEVQMLPTDPGIIYWALGEPKGKKVNWIESGSDNTREALQIIKRYSKRFVSEGYRILPNIDRERYQEREGLEGPFRARNGKVYYYDPKAGLAYDPDTDMYIDYNDLTMMDTDTMYENLQNDFSAFLQDLEKNTGIKGTIRKPGEQNIKPAYVAKPYSPEALEKMKAELPGLEADLRSSDPNGGYLERERYRNAKNRIGTIKSILAKNASDLDEGILAKAGGALALIAALWGVGEYAAKDAYENSPQLQKLVQYHQQATQMGDQAKLREIEKRIEMHKDRLALGKGEVMGSDDKPIVPTYEGLTGNERPRETKKEDDRITAAYRKKHLSAAGKKDDVKKDDIKKESSIMKGIQNEAKKIPDKCPKCDGKLVAESELNEEGNKDACYHKVKSRYKVWPSAYASGALVKCRKVGASNWGDKKK